MAERYGIETILRAVQKLKKNGHISNIQLSIVPKIKNEGNYLSKVLCQVQELGLYDCFHLLDPVPHHLMPDVIKKADISVYTPLPDAHMDIALSLKIPEVIAMGLPLVTTRLSVLMRYFGEDSLFMCEPGNVDDCAEKILEVYREPDKADVFVKRAKEKLRKIEWESQKLIYLNLIQSCDKC